MKRLDAYRVYLLLCAAGAALGRASWVVAAVYYVELVHTNPLQLVLVGTVMEGAFFLAQIPAGLFADAVSRRLSVIIGWLFFGACWILQSLVPSYGVILAGSVLIGLGFAFTDGAEAAWLAGEIGEDAFGPALLRGSQVQQLANILGVFAGVGLATVRLNLPLLVAGVLYLACAGVLMVIMPEEHFTPHREAGAGRLRAMGSAMKASVATIRGKRLIGLILAIAVVTGAFSEGLDRLWEAHFLKDLTFPHRGGFQPVIWFGIINAVTGVVNIGVAQVARQRLDTRSHHSVARVLLVADVLLSVSVIGFALAGNFWQAFATFVATSALRNLSGPLFTAWLNQQVTDSSVRATVLSMSGQADALGQFAGGPVIGFIATRFAIRTALTIAGLLLVPSLPLYLSALQHPQPADRAPEVLAV